MKFNHNLNAVPYNHPVLLQHRVWGIGIGTVRKALGAHLQVSFGCCKEIMGHCGVTTPTPVEIADFIGWADYPDDKPLEEMSVSLPALIRIREEAEHSSTYDNEEGMTNALHKIAEIAGGLLGELA